MNLQEILSRLEAIGDEKVYARNKKHGAGTNQFGVKLGDIRKEKKIKVDHDLAMELWNTKIMEARLLAIRILEPKKLSSKDLDEMVKSLKVPQVADWFNAYVLKEHSEKDLLREKLMDSENIWAARSGWSLTAGKVSREAKDLDLSKLLSRIEQEMPTAPPEVQWTMNTTLAQIGIHCERHRKRAVEIGEKLEVFKDYPVSKGCTSPFAPLWIKEIVRRKE